MPKFTKKKKGEANERPKPSDHPTECPSNVVALEGLPAPKNYYILNLNLSGSDLYENLEGCIAHHRWLTFYHSKRIFEYNKSPESRSWMLPENGTYLLYVKFGNRMMCLVGIAARSWFQAVLLNGKVLEFSDNNDEDVSNKSVEYIQIDEGSKWARVPFSMPARYMSALWDTPLGPENITSACIDFYKYINGEISLSKERIGWCITVIVVHIWDTARSNDAMDIVLNTFKPENAGRYHLGEKMCPLMRKWKKICKAAVKAIDDKESYKSISGTSLQHIPDVMRSVRQFYQEEGVLGKFNVKDLPIKMIGVDDESGAEHIDDDDDDDDDDTNKPVQYPSWIMKRYVQGESSGTNASGCLQSSSSSPPPIQTAGQADYSAGSLPFESEEFTVTVVDPEKKDKERAEREYKITIRIAGRTDLYHLQQFLCGRQRDMPQETIQVLDVVLRESPSWNYVTVSRSFFSTTFGHMGDIGEGLECWRGYYQSLRPTQMGLSLNIDISATSFFKPVTVIQFVQEFINLRDVSRPLNDRDRVKIKKALRGVHVETNHQQDQIRRYKITGITAIPMSQLIFPVDERGTRMSVVQCFSQRYEYNLQHTNWPCLQSGSDARPVYLPMEACKIVEGQRYSKKLNDKQVTNILRATCQRPQQREQSIREMVLHNKYAEDKFAQEFGIKVCNDLVSVPARVLPPPMLKYHDSGREKTCAPSVGQWNMIGKKMINGGTIDNWACLSFSRMRPEEIYRFCVDLIQMCNATGMSVNPRAVVDIRTATPNNIENTLRGVHMKTAEIKAKQGKGGQLQLLLVILPEVTGSYGKIKKVCETDLGIVSQCCMPRHASRPNKQYLENVALKINVKAGGRNTVLEKAFVRNGIPFVSKVPTIIFGADVTHPPPGEDSASSIAAVVASMDWPEITKYRGLLSAQPHRQEIIEDIFSVTKDPQRGTINGGMIRVLLIAFRRKTGRRPERIIFYRDGVSEGQFSHALLHEMDALRKACASLEEGYSWDNGDSAAKAGERMIDKWKLDESGCTKSYDKNLSSVDARKSSQDAPSGGDA